ncbi:NAD(P)/FAD-dependent oxidoreductase [Spiribacter vilamensis]|uniref:NADPH-dependent 2,4-dienoyl-CoA reductase/sulfur reductase-like enzyme n=1 Tax=Spiribacter vilamensis TaxID=531306 RepID=A0A4Q8D1W4_9GAMM|nr:FAD/NAD(P)-binding oxidoreductase [Spiribacter vilamensis]RZU99348.1 NADPH-dependent 2,4-dienoyl-CoA reductase/sulfur reductase-like enzyme [Spiribacter vilamensis]TVO61669.1 NAD(P)/FAD-dependent oxidoreductase [Spiribacter vilamensis]
MSIAIVGTGPAGAAAARGLVARGASVTLFDEQPRSGGNIHRVGATSEPTALETFARTSAHVELRTATRVLSTEAGGRVWFDGGDGAESEDFDAIVLACGAYDVHDPVPGLPAAGVSSAGALQALVKGQGIVPSGSVVIAGSGPFLSVVAAGLVRTGVAVTHVLDRLRWSDYLRLAPWGVGLPGNSVEFLQTRQRLWRSGVNVRHGVGVSDVAEGRVITDTNELIPFDHLGLSERFVPQTQLARTAGCRLEHDPVGGYWAVVTDAVGRTSQPGIYVIGEGQGIRGWRHAELSGERVAPAIMADQRGESSPRPAGSGRRRFLIGFARGLERRQRARATERLRPDAVICPCEGTRVEAVDEAVALGLADLSSVKVVTRCGMGPCQGRYCEPQVTDRICAAGATPREALNQRAFSRPVSVAEVIDDAG